MKKTLLCYRGSVEAWEIDHMGHMNVQFYLKKAMHAVRIFFLKVGISYSESINYNSVFSLDSSHLRYLKEQKAGAPIYIEASIHSLSKNSFSIALIMKELLSKEPCASFLLSYKLNRNMNESLLSKLKKCHLRFGMKMPTYGMPRGLASPKVTTKASIEVADKIGMKETFLGVARGEYVDEDCLIGPENYMSIISNAVPNILSNALSTVDKSRFGGAALEYAFDYKSFGSLGTPLIVRSGLIDLGNKTFTWLHWIFDVKTNELLVEAKALVIALDLKERKSIEIPITMHRTLSNILLKTI